MRDKDTINEFKLNDKNLLIEDIKGHDSAKEELIQIIDYLKYPKKYNKLGATLPKGILL